jgi:hypothetical protein
VKTFKLGASLSFNQGFGYTQVTNGHIGESPVMQITNHQWASPTGLTNEGDTLVDRRLDDQVLVSSKTIFKESSSLNDITATIFLQMFTNCRQKTVG